MAHPLVLKNIITPDEHAQHGTQNWTALPSSTSLGHSSQVNVRFSFLFAQKARMMSPLMQPQGLGG